MIFTGYCICAVTSVFVSDMELAQHFSVSMNEYEESERTQRGSVFQTEDVYQSLQCQPTAAQRTNNSTKQVSGKKTEDEWMESINGINLHIVYNLCVTIPINLYLTEHCERKYLFLLFAMNILISTAILAIVGLNCKYHDSATGTPF